MHGPASSFGKWKKAIQARSPFGASCSAIWSEARETSLEDFRRLYRRLDIDFEHYEGESFYQGRMEAVIEKIAKTLGVKESQGALVVDMPYAEGEPPVLLRKSDGS